MSKKPVPPFGTRLKALREAAGLSQADLAGLAGMHRFGVAKIERGERSPNWETVCKLAEALGVNCLAFTAEDGPEPSKRRGRPRKEK